VEGVPERGDAADVLDKGWDGGEEGNASGGGPASDQRVDRRLDAMAFEVIRELDANGVRN
jgi:hypothetical protein